MANKLATAKTKTPKYPKSLGACTDLYHEQRTKRLAEQKEVDALKALEDATKNHIIDNLDKSDERGAVGKEYKAVVVPEDVIQVEDWDKFYDYIHKNKAYELLNRMLNKAAVAEHMNELNKAVDAQNEKLRAKGAKEKPRKLLPGTKVFRALKLSVTKVK